MQLESLCPNPALPAIGGMFVMSLLDAGGILAAESPVEIALLYGLCGACGGLAGYVLLRRLRG